MRREETNKPSLQRPRIEETKKPKTPTGDTHTQRRRGEIRFLYTRATKTTRLSINRQSVKYPYPILGVGSARTRE